MKVSDVMTRDFGTVEPGETLQAAAQLMADLDTDALPVGSRDALEGMVTGRDIVLRGVAQGLDPRSTPVREVMSSRLFICHPEDTIEDVTEQMERTQVRRMPVVDKTGRVVGMVSLKDVAGIAFPKDRSV